MHDRLVGWLPRYAPYAAKWPWLFNLRDRLPLARLVFEIFVQFSARRSLPKWRTGFFRDRFNWAYNIAATELAREVVLFADTFNRYFERENLDAAMNVLVAGVLAAQAAGRLLRPHLRLGA